MTKTVQLHVHLVNGKRFVIHSQFDKAVALIKYSRRSGEPLEWPDGEHSVMTIFPEMILGYSRIYDVPKAKEEAKEEPKEKAA